MAIYTIPVTVTESAPHLMLRNGGVFDRARGRWKFVDVGDAASAAIDLYRLSQAQLELKRRQLRQMVKDGTAINAWGYDEFGGEIDIEYVAHEQADALIAAGREARKVLGSRRLFLARTEVDPGRAFAERVRSAFQRYRRRGAA